MSTNVVVLGAGVSGLTTALLLSKDPNYKITIVAKHMPGDYDIEYASPWAGADFVPPNPAMGAIEAPLEIETWPELERLARDLPEAGVHFQSLHSSPAGVLRLAKPGVAAKYYRRRKDVGTEKGEWLENLLHEDNPFRKMLPNFHTIPESDLPDAIDAGISFTTVCINTALYLPWLASQCLKAGVIIRRGVVSHVTDAAGLHHSGKAADVIVNCTGLSVLHLGGVEDTTMYPARGQVAIVRNDPGFIFGSTGTDDGSNESMYIMNRAGGGGCVLGGCSLKNVWESQFDPNLAVRIMKRAVDMCPSLIPEGKGIEGLSVIRHAVGLRPMRVDGIRIERELVKGANGSIVVVHNYGHGGRGYQTSYGAAKRAIGLVSEGKQITARL